MKSDIHLPEGASLCQTCRPSGTRQWMRLKGRPHQRSAPHSEGAVCCQKQKVTAPARMVVFQDDIAVLENQPVHSKEVVVALHSAVGAFFVADVQLRAPFREGGSSRGGVMRARACRVSMVAIQPHHSRGLRKGDNLCGEHARSNPGTTHPPVLRAGGSYSPACSWLKARS